MVRQKHFCCKATLFPPSLFVSTENLKYRNFVGHLAGFVDIFDLHHNFVVVYVHVSFLFSCIDIFVEACVKC